MFYNVFCDFFLIKKETNFVNLLPLETSEQRHWVIPPVCRTCRYFKCDILLRITLSGSSRKTFDVISNINQPLSAFIGTALPFLASDILTWVSKIALLQVYEKQWKDMETFYFRWKVLQWIIPDSLLTQQPEKQVTWKSSASSCLLRTLQKKVSCFQFA